MRARFWMTLYTVVASSVIGTTSPASVQERPTADRVNSWIAGLNDPNVEVRRASAIAIREADPETRLVALPAMINVLMEEKDGQVRLPVFDAVTDLGPDAAPAVPALLHALHTPFGDRRMEQTHQDFRAALALASVGKAAVEGLRETLSDRRENVRAEAVMALGRIGPDASAAIADLIALLGDPSDRIGHEVSVALGSIGPEAVGPLIAAAEHADTVVRARSVEALGHSTAISSGGRVLEVLLLRADDPAAEVRARAVEALGGSPADGSALADVLGRSLRDEQDEVRGAAVHLLSSRPELLRQLIPLFDSLLSDANEGIAWHAAFLLHLLGPEAAPTLLNALGRETSQVDQIAKALGLIGRPIGGLLMEATENPNPRTRRGAALALGRLRPPAPGSVSRLMAGLDDPDPEVRTAFLHAIGELGPRGVDALPAVRSLLRDESVAIRLEAIAVVHRLAPKDDRLPGELASILNDDDPRVQQSAIEILRSLGPASRPALPKVIEKLQGPDPKVRIAAAELIAAHGPAASEAVPALGAMLEDPNSELRVIAAQTLATLGSAAQPMAALLIPMLDDTNARAREAAVLAVGSLELDADTLRPHLVRTLRDEDADVRDATRRAIQRLGPEGALFVPDLISLAALESDRRSVERSLRRFERTGPLEGSIPELIDLLEHQEEAVRLLAIKFLGLGGVASREAIPSLERLRDDPSPEVREQVEAVLGQITPEP
ncbi:HEAT repeat domain-containing protein [Tautonia rosea]|uniref:HEAT repeat domain-containing protein n=1 Tax=Tautonia rosea TaxID=2728037 RepID=UPI00147377D2|nr:HEAT repeat domain-containing protein [Tautonia rosea]